MLPLHRSHGALLASALHPASSQHCQPCMHPAVRLSVRAHSSPSSSSNTASSSNSKPAKPEYTPSEYLSPFSAVDPAMKDTSSSSSSGQDPAADDKWGDVLSVNHTLSSLYLQQLEVSGPWDIKAIIFWLPSRKTHKKTRPVTSTNLAAASPCVLCRSNPSSSGTGRQSVGKATSRTSHRQAASWVSKQRSYRCASQPCFWGSATHTLSACPLPQTMRCWSGHPTPVEASLSTSRVLSLLAAPCEPHRTTCSSCRRSCRGC